MGGVAVDDSLSTLARLTQLSFDRLIPPAQRGFSSLVKAAEAQLKKAEMQLATSQYRMSQLNSHGMFQNNVEDALRDCRR